MGAKAMQTRVVEAPKSAFKKTTSRHERPILFSGPMVRAILTGRKTQTRRVARFGPLGTLLVNRELLEGIRCPHGAPGDALWVRESVWYLKGKKVKASPFGEPHVGGYVADGEPAYAGEYRKVPAIHMPRWASRLTLEVTDVRVQRLQDISEEDAEAEGFFGGWEEEQPGATWYRSARSEFEWFWNSINKQKAPWNQNPWVWALTFRRLS